jgi:dTDP-4-amino-4,6-dideoxygalactose transaminase
MWKVQLFELNYDKREADAVADVIKSGWLTMGEKTKEFETSFSEMLGEKVLSVAVSNGTAALHTALLGLGIGEGDKVIIPALTFVADINVVRLTGATPIIADCTDYNDWNISAKTIRNVITDGVKAVMVVHYAGYPCNMDEISALCKEKGIYLIEDCAHAPGAKYKGRCCGTFGDYGCFSFFTNKNLSVGEGGMVTAKDELLSSKAQYIRSHGMTSLTLDRHKGRAISYDVVQSGLNYRIDEMRAALGLVQMEKLKEANLKRKVLVEKYRSLLNGMASLTIPFQDTSNKEPVYHIFPMLLKEGVDRLSVIEYLKKDGIQSSIHYPAFRGFAAFKGIGLNEAPVAENIAQRELTLPLFPTMTANQVEVVCGSLKKALGE